MIETCPRCSSRLGPPLTSGRQVCVECGWSTAPASKRTKAAPLKRKPSALMRIVVLCWRIIKRAITFLFLLLQNKVEQLKASQPRRKDQTQKLVQGLTNRLSALEEAIPTSVDAKKRSWMTTEDAFEALGGDPQNPNSLITSLNGRASVSFPRFCKLRSDEEFRAFGLESDWNRRSANQPWLRQIS